MSLMTFPLLDEFIIQDVEAGIMIPTIHFMNYVVSTTIPFINSGVLKVEPSICFFFPVSIYCQSTAPDE